MKSTTGGDPAGGCASGARCWPQTVDGRHGRRPARPARRRRPAGCAAAAVRGTRSTPATSDDINGLNMLGFTGNCLNVRPLNLLFYRILDVQAGADGRNQD